MTAHVRQSFLEQALDSQFEGAVQLTVSRCSTSAEIDKALMI
jgi:hypothetical protein